VHKLGQQALSHKTQNMWTAKLQGQCLHTIKKGNLIFLPFSTHSLSASSTWKSHISTPCHRLFDDTHLPGWLLAFPANQQKFKLTPASFAHKNSITFNN